MKRCIFIIYLFVYIYIYIYIMNGIAAFITERGSSEQWSVTMSKLENSYQKVSYRDHPLSIAL